MTITVVLVGGPCDGRRLAVDPAMRYIRVAQQPSLQPTSYRSGELQEVPVTCAITEYAIVIRDGDWAVACPYQSPGVMQNLIQGYRAEVQR